VGGHHFGSLMSDLGFDVFVFDQAGAGYPDRLPFGELGNAPAQIGLSYRVSS
jgi:hypothetical protein